MLEFYAVKVTKVKDGDTFVGDIKMGSFGMTLHDQTFRMNTIDTPELHPLQPLALEAKEFTAQHIDGKDIIVYLHGKDSFGRWITDVYIDGDLNTRLNDMLMKEGLAKLYKRGE